MTTNLPGTPRQRKTEVRVDGYYLVRLIDDAGVSHNVAFKMAKRGSARANSLVNTLREGGTPAQKYGCYRSQGITVPDPARSQDAAQV